ncbi:MAG: hypothetical protein J6T67_10535 [Paludibacteraceae bacterium]|nr:hypothetical protein [Paludibacteraceae bacterium]MBR4713934.1 hypothetical protein [Paludibacteraceae bacterium]
MNRKQKNSSSVKREEVAQSKTTLPLKERVKGLLSNKYFHIFLLVIVTVVFYVNYNAIFDRKLDMNGDNIVYYSLGQSLHNGTGYSNITGFEVKPHTHFPPGYPAFISAMLNFTRDGNYVAIKKANGFMLLLSIIMLFYAMKRVTGKNVVVAFSAAILFCVQKDLLRWSTIMMSEMLFLFLSVAVLSVALLLHRRKSFREYSKWDFAALGAMLLSIAYIYFVRTMGISLILALFGWYLLLALWQGYKYLKTKKVDESESVPHRKGLCYYACMAALVLLPFGVAKFAWGLRNQAVGHVQTDYIGDFKKKGGNGEVMSTWSDWSERVYSNSKTYLTKLIPETVLTKTFEKDDPITGYDIMVGFFVLALVIIGLIHTGWGGFLIFSYLAITFGVLLFWPEQFTSVRYYVAVVPLILFLFLNGVWNSVSFIAGKVNKSWLKSHASLLAAISVVIAAFFWLIPLQSKAQTNYRQFAKSSYKQIVGDQNFLNYYEAMDWCKKNLPDSSRMVCRKPELYYIYSGFKKSVSFPYYAPEDTVINYLNRINATNVILDNWFKHAYVTLYPAVKKYPEKFKVLHTIGELDTVKKVNPVYIIEYNRNWGFDGKVVNGKKEGYGVYNYQDGRKYVGNFVDDKPDGEGSFYDGTGKLQYQGTWHAGNYKDGKGYAIYGDKRYEGEFKNGAPGGYGVYSDTLGHVLAKGIWRNGMLVQPQ